GYDDGYRWFKRELKIPVVDSDGQKIGELGLGNLVFLADKVVRANKPLTLGTNLMHRRFIADLLTDTLLDFVRANLSQLTDVLGARLSRLKEANIESWHREVEKIGRAADLLWVVASHPSGFQRLGAGEAVVLIDKLESHERSGDWKSPRDSEGDLWIYSLAQP